MVRGVGVLLLAPRAPVRFSIAPIDADAAMGLRADLHVLEGGQGAEHPRRLEGAGHAGGADPMRLLADDGDRLGVATREGDVPSWG